MTQPDSSRLSDRPAPEPAPAPPGADKNPPDQAVTREQTRLAGVTIAAFLAIAILLYYVLPAARADLLHNILQVTVVVIAGGLPVILYQSFSRGRLQTLFNEYRQNLRRLGFPENADIYQEKFAETYGRTPQIARRGEPDAAAGRRFSPLSEIPILIAAILSLLGWINVFYPPAQPNAPALTPNTSPVIFGFLGAYVFGLAALVRQYVGDDLQPRYYASLTTRYITVFVLAWLIGLVPTAGEAGLSGDPLLLAAFGMGLFPLEWLRIVARKALQLFGSNARGLDEPSPLSQLDGMNAFKEDRLSLEGIENLQNMACANLVDLILKTRFPVEQLVDWIDQSLLRLHTRGLLPAFQLSGVRTATDFLDIFQPDDLPPGRRAPSSLGPEQKLARRQRQAALIQKLLAAPLDPAQPALQLDEAQAQTLLESAAVALVNAPNMFHVQYWRQHEFEALPEDVERIRTTADLKLMQGLPGEAIEIYDAAFQRFPNNFTTLLYRGLAYFQQGDYARAIDNYQSAVDQAGSRWEYAKTVYMELGRAYRELEDYPRAREMYEKALTEDPAFSEARMELAYLQMTRLAEYDAASANLSRLIQDGFKKAEAYSNRGLVRFEQWKLPRQPDEPAPADLLAQAQADLRQALRLDPAQVPAYINLANVLIELKLPAQAIDVLSQALVQITSQRSAIDAARLAQGSRAARTQALADNAYRARLMRGNLYLAQPDYPLAIQDYLAATQIAPYDAAAFYNLGLAYQRNNQAAEATQAYREAVRLKPGHAPAQQALGDQLAAAGSSAEAERAYANALRLTRELTDLPGQAQAHYSLGSLYRQDPARWAEARRELSQARAMSDELDDDLLFTRATYELGRLEKDGIAAAAAAADPAAQAEQVGQAISLLETSAALFEAIERPRDSLRASLELAEVLLQAGQAEGARQTYERAAALLTQVYDPGSPEDKALSEEIARGLAVG